MKKSLILLCLILGMNISGNNYKTNIKGFNVGKFENTIFVSRTIDSINHNNINLNTFLRLGINSKGKDISNIRSWSTINNTLNINLENFNLYFKLYDYIFTRTVGLSYHKDDFSIGYELSNNDYLNGLNIKFKGIEFKINMDRINISFNYEIPVKKRTESTRIDGLELVKRNVDFYNIYTKYFYYEYDYERAKNLFRLPYTPSEFEQSMSGVCNDSSVYASDYFSNLNLENYIISADSMDDSTHSFNVVKDNNEFLIFDQGTFYKTNYSSLENSIKSYWNSLRFYVMDKNLRIIKTIYSDKYINYHNFSK